MKILDESFGHKINEEWIDLAEVHIPSGWNIIHTGGNGNKQIMKLLFVPFDRFYLNGNRIIFYLRDV